MVSTRLMSICGSSTAESSSSSAGPSGSSQSYRPDFGPAKFTRNSVTAMAAYSGGTSVAEDNGSSSTSTAGVMQTLSTRVMSVGGGATVESSSGSAGPSASSLPNRPDFGPAKFTRNSVTAMAAYSGGTTATEVNGGASTSTAGVVQCYRFVIQSNSHENATNITISECKMP